MTENNEETEIIRKRALEAVSASTSQLINSLDQSLADLKNLPNYFPGILEKEDPEYRYFLDTGFKALNKATACIKVFKTLIQK